MLCTVCWSRQRWNQQSQQHQHCTYPTTSTHVKNDDDFFRYKSRQTQARHSAPRRANRHVRDTTGGQNVQRGQRIKQAEMWMTVITDDADTECRGTRRQTRSNAERGTITQSSMYTSPHVRQSVLRMPYTCALAGPIRWPSSLVV